jgi:hypothetical protein
MMRHEETGRDTVFTSTLSAATERVRQLPVTLVAEPNAPLCACERPRISWGEVHGRDPRFVPWFCAGCLGAGFIAFPGADDWCGIGCPPDLTYRKVTAPLEELADAIGETVDAVGLYIRHAGDLIARRARHSSIGSVTAGLNDGIAATVRALRERYEAADLARRVEDVRRGDEHAALVRKLRRGVEIQRARIDRGLARRATPAPSANYAVIVRGSEIVRQLIYGLVDPNEPGRIRYVGKTTAGAHARFLGHVSDATRGTTKRADWIASLVADGRYPDMVLLEDVAAGLDLDARERWWIIAMRERGEGDLNTVVPSVCGSAS